MLMRQRRRAYDFVEKKVEFGKSRRERKSRDKFNLRGSHMRTKLVRSFALIVGLLVVCGSMLAHHGNAAYDENHPITLTGIVTEFVWANPHCQIYVDVKDVKGNVVSWSVESMSPGILHRNGWTKSSVKPGDQIAITLIPAKNGAPVGFSGLNSGKIVFPDRRVLTMYMK
jgi:Family of unknown function (DUF6152)